MSTPDSGERRRLSDARSTITQLIDAGTVLSIAEDAWTALVGEDEVLVPLPAGPATDPLSGWVQLTGPWTGIVAVTTGRATAEQLASCMLKEHAPPVLDDEDVADALGEMANVVGGNIKAVLPPPAALSLPEVGSCPAVANPADVCHLDVLWRGQPLTISVQGVCPPLPVARTHNEGAAALTENGVPL